MKIIDFIKKKLGFDEDDYYDEFGDQFEVQLDFDDESEPIADVIKRAPVKRADINILDYRERDMYVRDRCEQMQLASEEIESQKKEYQKITERLADFDEINSLPPHNYRELVVAAKRIIKVEEEERDYVRPTSKITDSQYREMERLEADLPSIIKKIRKEEDYQMTVKRDLNLLEGEKGALAYQRKEEKTKAANSKAAAVICVFVSVMAACLLLALQITLSFEVRLGYYIILAFLSLSLMGISVTYRNSIESQAKTEKKINRAINLQNSVKIKYVNTTNLIDFYYAKYNINNSYELSYMFEKYIEEKNARNHSEEMAKKLESARKELANLLRQYRINDVSLFVYEPYILADEDEMSDVRKKLIIQRQKLKKGMDFNSYSLEMGKAEIEELVRQYPKFSKEILAIVSQYSD